DIEIEFVGSEERAGAVFDVGAFADAGERSFPARDGSCAFFSGFRASFNAFRRPIEFVFQGLRGFRQFRGYFSPKGPFVKNAAFPLTAQAPVSLAALAEVIGASTNATTQRHETARSSSYPLQCSA